MAHNPSSNRGGGAPSRESPDDTYCAFRDGLGWRSRQAPVPGASRWVPMGAVHQAGAVLNAGCSHCS